MVNDMFREELDDDVIEEIANNLSLSDLLALDKAYTIGDKETVRSIIGPLPQLEYSMGVGRQPASAASNRPAPRAPVGQQQKKEPGTQNTVQTNRNYNSGAQNAVTTQKIDTTAKSNDPNAMQQDGDEPIKEDAGMQYFAIIKNYAGSGEGYTLTGPYASENEAWKDHGGDVDVIKTFDDLPEKWQQNITRRLANDDYIQASISADAYNKLFAENKSNVVDMVEWLKRRAGIK
jgi:hypothetical protein